MTTRIPFLLCCAWVLAGALCFGGCSPKAAVEGNAPKTEWISGPAGKIHMDDGGEGGLPVVFAHSYAGNSTHWAAQLAHLRPTRRAIAFDFRGHGQSDSSASGDYSISSLAEDIAAVADSLHLQRFVLVGHSMGGAASLRYAASHPTRVEGLVLVGTPGKTSPEMAAQILTALENDYDKTMEEFWSRLLAKAKPQVAAQLQAEKSKVSRDTSLKIIRGVFEFDAVPALSVYRGPKLIIDEEQDDDPGALHHLAPGAPHRIIQDASHWMQMDKPEEFNEILDEFLETLD